MGLAGLLRPVGLAQQRQGFLCPFFEGFWAGQGFYVLVDWHNSGKGNQVGDIAFTDATQFGNDWVQLVKDLKSQGSIPGKLMIDLINEPDAYAIRCAMRDFDPTLPFSVEQKKK